MLSEQGPVEKFVTSPDVTAVTTFVASAVAAASTASPNLAILNPWMPLFPALASCAAGALHQKNLNQAMERIQRTFQELGNKNDLSEQQYHLVTEAVSAVFQTINSEKLEYLQRVIKGALELKDLDSQESSLLGRLIRDISAPEADFVCKHFGNDYIYIGKEESRVHKTLSVREHTSESLTVKGLVGLGVLDMLGGDGNLFSDDFGEGTYFKFSLLAPKIIFLLRTA